MPLLTLGAKFQRLSKMMTLPVIVPSWVVLDFSVSRPLDSQSPEAIGPGHVFLVPYPRLPGTYLIVII